MSSHVERLRALEQIEKDIAQALENAAQVVSELAKDKPVARTTESHAQTFLKTVNGIETNLMKQLDYLSHVVTTHPHTGSSYGPQKDLQMATQRMDYVVSRLNELDKLRMEHTYRQTELRRALSHQAQFPPIGGAAATAAPNQLPQQ